MTLAEQITTDQTAVFFNLDDFAVQAVIDGRAMTVLLHDLLLQDSGNRLAEVNMDGVLVDRKVLQIRPDDLTSDPVAGMEIEVNGRTYVIESVGGGRHEDESGALPWDLLLVRYLT